MENEKWYNLSLSMRDSTFKVLEEVTTKFGFRNLGHTIESAIFLLKSISDSQENGLKVGVLDVDAFYPWIFSKAKTVEKTDDFFGRIVNCQNCGKDFILTEGIVYRESPDHEGMRHVECLHCSYTNDF